MNLGRLALRNIAGNAFRSWVVFLCALAVAGFSLSVTLIIRGAEVSLRLARERLGADIIVVPKGSEGRIENALLMGRPTTAWMPKETVTRVAAVPGVAAASPQLYLASLANAACCDASEMFVVAFDPKTDFTVTPWLTRKLGDGLHLGEAVGGRLVYAPPGESRIKLYGYLLTLKANLELTGTGLDQSMFLTFETARDVARVSRMRAEKPLEVPPDSISAVLVNVRQGSDAYGVALKIRDATPGVTPITSPELFQSFRGQMTGLLHGFLAILGTTWAVSVLLIGLVFSMATNERRREIGVLRALGATRGFVFRSVLGEAALLALGGGLVGGALAALAVSLFRNLLVTSLGIPFLLPSLPGLLVLVTGGLAVALLSVALAALIPAYRISRQDPAVAMRE
jgi:putative ABC transport system permease protein